MLGATPRVHYVDVLARADESFAARRFGHNPAARKQAAFHAAKKVLDVASMASAASAPLSQCGRKPLW